METKRVRVYTVAQRSRMVKAEQENSRRWRIRVMMFLGGKCERCGFNDYRALQFDHINGDGAKQRREFGGRNSGAMARYIIQHPSEFQVLCANCNWIKRAEKNEHTLWRDYSQQEELKEQEA